MHSGSPGRPFRSGTPLAERMRPRTLDEIAGQDALVGPGGVLRRLAERRELTSILLWGPPGSGKTTVARVLAAAADAEFVSFSAVLSGVKEARSVMEAARSLRAANGRRSILFVDEVHRFNRAQQDAFLPYVESGDIVLIGATTENPSFELNAALLSRVKVYVLEPLGDAALRSLLDRALVDVERGLGGRHLAAAPAALDEIVRLAGGDARVALSLLELAADSLGDGGALDLDAVRSVAQRKLARYDKEGEEHFNLISALHKSVRNSDVDASLYWLARMLEGGADARFVARRGRGGGAVEGAWAYRSAGEPGGAAAHAAEHVGMPECALALAQATVYLALAPKSNALYLAYGRAQGAVRDRPAFAVPLHLRNAPTRLMGELGYGEGYRYAHDEPGRVADMTCLPAELSGLELFHPSDEGWEKRIGERLREILAKKRERGR